MIKQGMRTALMALALAGGMMASAPAHAEGTLTVSSPQDPGSWDPVDTFLVNWASVATNIYDGLTYRGPDTKLVPGLATSWEVLDDGLRIRFALREGVTFHNGEPFNADAVKFTFDRLMGEEGKKARSVRTMPRLIISKSSTITRSTCTSPSLIRFC